MCCSRKRGHPGLRGWGASVTVPGVVELPWGGIFLKITFSEGLFGEDSNPFLLIVKIWNQMKQEMAKHWSPALPKTKVWALQATPTWRIIVGRYIFIHQTSVVYAYSLF